MKKVKVLMFCLGLFLNGNAQTELSLKKLMVQTMKINLKPDSLNKPVYRTDSIDVLLLMVFDHLTNEISELNINIGKSKDDAGVFKKTIRVINKENKYYIQEGKKPATTLNYGKNLVLKYRIKNNDGLKWVTVYYKNEQKKMESTKSYFEIKK